MVKSYLLWIVLQGEEDSIDEDEPAHHAQDDQAVAKRRLVEIQNLARVEVELLHEEERHVHDDVAADEDGELDAAGLPELGPGDRVALGQEDQQQQEDDLPGGLQHAPRQLGRGRPVPVHAVGEVGECGEGEAASVEQHLQ